MIGLSTVAGPRNYWHLWLKKKHFNMVELDLRHSYFPFYQFIINIIKKEMEPFNLSIHSASEALFSENKIIREGYQKLLIAEIELAKIIEAKEIVFHAPSFFGFDELIKNEDIVDFLAECSEAGKKKDITLLLEYPSTGPFTKTEDLMKFFEKFSNFYLCLDICHLHKVNKELNKELEIIEKLKDKIVHIHVNKYLGEDNLNNSLEEKEKHYKGILKKIKEMTPVKKIIIETLNEENVKYLHRVISEVF